MQKNQNACKVEIGTQNFGFLVVDLIKNFLEASEIATMNAAEKLKNELIVNIDDVDEDDEALIADYIIHPEPQLDSQSDSFTNNGDDRWR